ncbi:MAG: LptF/LptG family permease [Puniceicoccales bacterium]|jgi:lipopolysaccharide export LptBFGC system permease protein LptF|nr:LptF/LptG family permease [Puniceicoccales bacterium]
MKHLDRHLAIEFGKRFFLIFLALNAFLLFSDIYAHLEKFLAKHASIGELFYYFLANGIGFLALTVPLAFLGALIFSFYSMHRNNETILLLSSGISAFRIMRIFWVLGLVLSLLILLGNFFWIPWAREYAGQYLESLEKGEGESGTHYAKHLTLGRNNRLWYINRYDKRKAHAYGIAIYDYDGKGNEWRRIGAESGYFDGKNKNWILERGRETLFQKHMADEVRLFESRSFSEFSDSPRLLLLLQLPPRELSLPQLREIMDHEIGQENLGNDHYRMRFWDIILSSFFCILACWLALALLFSKPHKLPLPSIAQLTIILLIYIIFSHILYALGQSGSLHWLMALLLPIGFVCILPLFFLAKLF